jgi:hypothetical protein
MIPVAFPDLPEQALVLEPDRRYRSGTGGLPEEDGTQLLAGRIALGGPYAVPVTPDYVAADPELRTFVVQEAAHNVYYLVHLSVSFAAEPTRPRLERLAIELRLSSSVTPPTPVAWSMAPLRLSDSVQVEHGFRLGPELKLAGAEFKVGEVERNVSEQRAKVFLQAQRELRSDPAWEFTSARKMSLYGSYRLVMVVRTAKDAATSVSSTLRAATRGNLLHRYRRELPESLPLTTVL